MIINHNMNAMNAHRMMSANTVSSGKSMEKLSSGLRINRAGDDAAGLAISEKMRGQIRGLDQASRNSQDAISLIQTAEGALNETHSILQRMRELSVQASNDTNNSNDRGQIQKEMDQLTSEVNRIANTTEFNTMKLLNGDRKAGTGPDSSIAVGSALGITAAGTLVLASDIKISTTGTDIDWKSMNSAATTNTIQILNDNGKLRVKISAADSSAVSASISADDTIDPTKVVGDTITYNNHGVSFTIKKTDLAAAANGDNIKLTIATADNDNDKTGSYSTNNDFSANASKATITGGITVDPNTFDPRIKGIKISSTDIGTNSATATLKVQFFADTAGTTALDTDTIVLTGTTSITAGITYSQHGISFKITATTAGVGFTSNILETGVTDDKSLAFQVGANQNQSMGLGISDMSAKALGITTTTTGTAGFGSAKTVTDGTNNTAKEFSLNVTTTEGATNAITIVQSAIDKVSDERSKLGAVQNRLEHTITNLGTSSENLQSAESRIRDVDMAKEMMTFSKNNILSQAAQAMLAQANQQPQGVLQLLR